MSFQIADYFSEPLHDLGTSSPALHGIWAPASEAAGDTSGVTDQFLANAATYHERYANVPYFRELIERAFQKITLPADAVVLDIGSGSGNSVFGCLDLLPDAHVVATDISPDLLAILRDGIESDAQHKGRVTPVCMSAMNDPYREGAFDLAVGAAILHHLIDPGAALQALGRALRPGGCAVFFEPFENGNAILRLAYSDLVERARDTRPSPEHGRAFEILEALVRDYAFRAGSDKSDPMFAEVDDKWLFTRSMFERFAERGGFSGVEIVPLHDVDEPFTTQTRTNLKLGGGLEPDALPEWCWERLSRIDQNFSPELKHDLLIEGRVILRK